MTEHRDPEDRDLADDRIGRFLADELRQGDSLDPEGMRRGYRPARARVVTVAVVLLALGGIVTALALKQERAGEQTTRPQQVVPVANKEAPEPSPVVQAGRVALATGTQWIFRTSMLQTLRVGDEVHVGDVVKTTDGAAVGIRWEDGTSVVLHDQGEMRIESMRSDEVRVSLLEGILAARSPGEPGSVRLVVSGRNGQLRARDAVFTVRAGKGSIVRADVLEGQIRAHRGKDEGMSIPAGAGLDGGSWSTRPEAACHMDALNRLSSFVPGFRVPTPSVGPADPDASSQDASTAAPSSPSLEARIQQALDAGDLQEAVRLVESKDVAEGSASFMFLAGEVYRRAQKWDKAAQAYQLAASSSSGKKAQMALLRAAEIHLRKLDDVFSAAAAIDDYLSRFPDGQMLDQALFTGGVVHTRAGNVDRALELLGQYLAKFPQNPQCTRVHLMMAKLLAGKKGNCKAATPHLNAVLTVSREGTLADQARDVAHKCGLSTPVLSSP